MLDLVSGAVEQPMWTKLLYATCFIHSTVHTFHMNEFLMDTLQVIERKRFGPLGWCISYEFNHTDLVASSLFLENYLYSVRCCCWIFEDDDQ